MGSIVNSQCLSLEILKILKTRLVSSLIEEFLLSDFKLLEVFLLLPLSFPVIFLVLNCLFELSSYRLLLFLLRFLLMFDLIVCLPVLLELIPVLHMLSQLLSLSFDALIDLSLIHI